MKLSLATTIGIIAITATASAGNAPMAPSVDSRAPNRIFADVCVECHEQTDWQGESAKDVENVLRGIMTGKVKHKAKITMNEFEVIAMSNYLTK